MSLLFYNRAEGKGEFYWITDGKGTLQLLGSHTDWRKTWTHMVDCIVPSLLFYDAASGAAEFYQLNENADMQLLSGTTFSKGWTHIVCLGQAADSNFASEVLFYNASNGIAQFYLVDAQGGMQQQTHTTFSEGWTHIEPFTFAQGNTGLLFYNSSNGLTQVYNTDGRSITQQLFNSTFSIGWTQVVAHATQAIGSHPVLFYNSTSGAARYTVINEQGNVSQVASTTYANGWTHILAGTLSGDEGVVLFAFLFYNATTGAAQFYQLNGPGSITQLSKTTFAKGWSEILWLVLP
jgi:hypothetical protein